MGCGPRRSSLRCSVSRVSTAGRSRREIAARIPSSSAAGVWERRFAGQSCPHRLSAQRQHNQLEPRWSDAASRAWRLAGRRPFPATHSRLQQWRREWHGYQRSRQTIDFWLPLFLGEDPRRDDRTLDVVAKLRPGVTLAQAQAEMDVVAHALADAFPATNRNWTVQVVPLRSHILGATKHVVLLLLLASVLVLVIACGNVSTFSWPVA